MFLAQLFAFQRASRFETTRTSSLPQIPINVNHYF
jgi:hypothetical protein